MNPAQQSALKVVKDNSLKTIACIDEPCRFPPFLFLSALITAFIGG